MALTQQELESRLWAAANSLRGPVDPADFKAYIFPLLFFKRISDAWDDEHSRVLADAYAAHSERFVKGPPRAEPVPIHVWINEPKKEMPGV